MKICIDAGHNYSGFDTGAVGNGLREQDVTFVIAQKLNELLRSVGVTTVMTRPTLHTNLGDNAKEAINERYRIANTNNCDYFISIHTNSFVQPSARGTETLIYGSGGQAEKLAEKVNNSIVKALNLTDRGIKIRTDLAVLKHTNMPAILVETAFISNPDDAKLLDNNSDDFAEAIFDGVCEHIGIVTESENQATSEENDIVCKLSSVIEINDKNGAISSLAKAKKDNSSLYWMLKKIADTLPDEVQEESSVPETVYKVIGTTHVLEIDPRRIFNVETQCATNKVPYDNFVNNVFFMAQGNGIMFPQGMVVNAGKVMSNYQTHQKPVATILIKGPENVEMKYVSDITKEENVWFAVSGYGIYPNITAQEEGFTGAFSDVTRSTARPIIGYRKADNKIVIAVRDNSSAERAKETAKNLNLDFAISLDGGGSTTLKVNGEYKFKGDGRKLYGGIIW